MTHSSEKSSPQCIDDIQFSVLDTDNSYKLYTSVMKKRLAYVNMPQKEFEDFISYEKQFLEFLSKEKFTDLMVIINKKDFIHNWALTEEEYSKLEQSLNILSLKKEMNTRLGYKSNQKTQPLKTNIQPIQRLKESSLSINPMNFSQQENAGHERKPSENLSFKDFKERVRMAESKVLGETKQNLNQTITDSVHSVTSRNSAISEVKQVSIQKIEDVQQIGSIQQLDTDQDDKENVDVETKSVVTVEFDDEFTLRAPKSSQKTLTSQLPEDSKGKNKINFSFMDEPPNSIAQSKVAQITPNVSSNTLMVEKNTKKIQTSPVMSKTGSQRSMFSKGNSVVVNWNLTTQKNLKSTYSLSSATSFNPQSHKIDQNAGNTLQTKNPNFKKKPSVSNTKMSLASSKISLNSHKVTQQNNVIRIRGDRTSTNLQKSNLSDLQKSSITTLTNEQCLDNSGNQKHEVFYSGEFGTVAQEEPEEHTVAEIKDQTSKQINPQDDTDEQYSDNESVQTVESMFDELRSIK